MFGTSTKGAPVPLCLWTQDTKRFTKENKNINVRAQKIMNLRTQNFYEPETPKKLFTQDTTSEPQAPQILWI